MPLIVCCGVLDWIGLDFILTSYMSLVLWCTFDVNFYETLMID